MIDNENRQQNSTINVDGEPADSTLGTETNTTAQAPSKSEKNWMYYFHEILKGIAIFK
ncbi:hypothetical protein [Paenibacillus sp. FSL H7-0326]|uniref:hypothetical protein n=1 Tax=Paenibacillus sp. FSL H7-0326 TaxID=1921144 RepID=UPI0015C31875|nr:hypothetical protein [Paenibacillus sp. FSL H7-0326]